MVAGACHTLGSWCEPSGAWSRVPPRMQNSPEWMGWSVTPSQARVGSPSGEPPVFCVWMC